MKKIIFLLISIMTLSSNAATSNPDISLNALFLYRHGNMGSEVTDEARNGFLLQEAELRVTSNIDPNFRGDVVLALEQEVDEDSGEAGFHLEPEEAFVDTLSIPNFTLRMGKFYSYWGRSNQWHTHSYPFIDAPLTKEAIFGEEGLNETGIAISYLVPTPWYFEVVVQGVSGENEKVFGSESQNDIARILYIKNLWELNDDSTLEWNLAAGQGQNANDNQNTIYNSAFTYKWKPAQATDKQSFTLTTEYTVAEKLLDESNNNLGRTAAMSTWAQYQFNRSWLAQIRTEKVEYMEKSTNNVLQKNSALFGYVSSEYAVLRLQLDRIDDPNLEEVESRGSLQLNISMGAHPAHTY